MSYILSSLLSTFTIVVALKLDNIINAEDNKKTNFPISVIICVIISLVISVCYIQETEFFDVIALILYPIRYVLATYIANSNLKWKHLYTLVLYEFVVDIFASGLTNLFELSTGIPYLQFYSAILTAINAAMLTMLYIFHKKIYFISHSITGFLPKHLYFLILLAVICLCALSTLNNYPTDFTTTKQIIMNLIIVLFTFITAWIIFSLLVNVISKQYFSNTLAMMQNQVDIQIRHYDKLEKLNNEMHSFKHDYTNHLYSLRSLIQMNENDDAITYIDKLLNAKHSSHTMFCTGNKLADAILADKSDILPEGIEIEYQGIIPPTLDNLHLCVILTNALDNAIEECSKLLSPGKIKISAQEKQGYFVMTMINPTVTNLIFSDIPPTSKVDKEHHGMGLTNLRNVVKSYDGQMNINCENNYFELSIALKL